METSQRNPPVAFSGRVAGAYVQGFGPKASAPEGFLQVPTSGFDRRLLRTKEDDKMNRQRLFGATYFSGAALLLASCQASETSANNGASPQASATENSVENAVAANPPRPAATGPDTLSTMGDAGEPLTRVEAREETFAIEQVDAVDTLTLNGKPVSYTPSGLSVPSNVAANQSISLVGFFELPQASVAWVMIVGGTAGAATHVLVSAGSGYALPGQEIPGWDDRVTKRRPEQLE